MLIWNIWYYTNNSQWKVPMIIKKTRFPDASGNRKTRYPDASGNREL